jgi:AcrR family transcriptional regulator
VGRPSKNLLSIDRIVSEALALIDSGDEFAMRALAKRLGVAAPSLYYHVGDRDHLVNLIRDRLIADDPPPARVEGDWRDEIEAIVRTQRRSYAAHPHLVTVLVGTPITSEPVLELYERLASAFAEAGFEPRETAVYLEVLDSFALGVGLEQSAPSDVWHIESTETPLVAASGAWTDAVARVDAAFEFGLAALLDAIAARARA